MVDDLSKELETLDVLVSTPVEGTIHNDVIIKVQEAKRAQIEVKTKMYLEGIQQQIKANQNSQADLEAKVGEMKASIELKLAKINEHLQSERLTDGRRASLIKNRETLEKVLKDSGSSVQSSEETATPLKWYGGKKGMPKAKSGIQPLNFTSDENGTTDNEFDDLEDIFAKVEEFKKASNAVVQTRKEAEAQLSKAINVIVSSALLSNHDNMTMDIPIRNGLSKRLSIKTATAPILDIMSPIMQKFYLQTRTNPITTVDAVQMTGDAIFQNNELFIDFKFDTEPKYGEKFAAENIKVLLYLNRLNEFQNLSDYEKEDVMDLALAAIDPETDASNVSSSETIKWADIVNVL